MPDRSGNAQTLTVLSPIRRGHEGETAWADLVRGRLDAWNFLENSPMAKVPQTYLCRYFVLDDVFTQALAGGDIFGAWQDILSIFSDRARRRALPYEDHLQSRYLVFNASFHGDLDAYLRGMWESIADDIRQAWGFCYGFDDVRDAAGFIAYMKKCRVPASLFFVGANDDPLEAQLKALHVKQEFGKFVIAHQGLPAAALQQAYREFITRIEPANFAAHAWAPGQYRLQQEKA